jgi:hypothetical protein
MIGVAEVLPSYAQLKSDHVPDRSRAVSIKSPAIDGLLFLTSVGKAAIEEQLKLDR